jgi:hypothetical protein
MSFDITDQFGADDARITRAYSLRRCDRPPSPPLAASAADGASPPPALLTRAAARAAAAADNRPIAQRKPKRNSKRGLQHYGTVYAPSGFRPRAKATPKPFRDPPNDPRRQTTLRAKKRKRSTSPQRSASPPPPVRQKRKRDSTPLQPPLAARPSMKNMAEYMRWYREHKQTSVQKLAEKKTTCKRVAAHRKKIGKAAVNAKMRAYRAADPVRYFHDTWFSSLVGKLRGTRPSKFVDELRRR